MSVTARIVDGIAGVLGSHSTKRYYGRKPDKHDPRDYRYVPSPEVLNAPASGIDLRSQDTPIVNQGSLGSCTANCWLSMFGFVHKKMFSELYSGSRLQLYWDERKLSGNQDKDTGAEMRDGGKCLATLGVCPETMWPYNIGDFRQQPTPECYAEATKHKLVEYRSLDQDLSQIKACVAEGYPLVFGFNVAESFESTSVMRTGIVPMPKKDEKLVGGHCMMVVGYVDEDGKTFGAKRAGLLGSIGHMMRLLTGLRVFGVQPPKNHFICKNSWGADWGDDGYCYVPYQFLTDKAWCSDFWTVRIVTTGQTTAA